MTPEFSERLTPYCPLCSESPVLVFDEGHQAWCGNEGCPTITWDMYRTLDELMTSINPVTLGESPRPGPSA